jgi:hypothetical protein
MRARLFICLSVLLATHLAIGASANEVSQFRIPIRAQYSRIYELKQDVEQHFTADNRDEQVVEGLRKRICRETGTYDQLLTDFQNARTRHGLDEEYLLLGESMLALSEIASMYAILKGELPSPAPVPENERNEIRDSVLEELEGYARIKIDEVLKTEGLADILLAGSFEEARDEAVSQFRWHLEEKIADEMERLVGLRFYDGPSLREALHAKARSLVERGVAKLLVNVTSNQLIISVAATVLVRWIGPKIKEAFREKGNHEFRVERSVGTLRAASRRLNSLRGDTDLAEVMRAFDDAQRAIKATSYLQSDLRRAGKWTLLTQITDAIGELGDTIQFTSKRFLLDKPAHAEFFEGAEECIREIRALAACTGTPVVVQEEPHNPDPNFRLAYLVHVSQIRVEDDNPEWVDHPRWYTTPERPAGNEVRWHDVEGTISRPAMVSFKIDEVRGPFITAEQYQQAYSEIAEQQMIVTPAPWVVTTIPN